MGSHLPQITGPGSSHQAAAYFGALRTARVEWEHEHHLAAERILLREDHYRHLVRLLGWVNGEAMTKIDGMQLEVRMMNVLDDVPAVDFSGSRLIVLPGQSAG